MSISISREPADGDTFSVVNAANDSEPGYQVIRRNGSVTPFAGDKIAVALQKAFLAVEGTSAASSRRVHDVVAELSEAIIAGLTRHATAGRTFHIEDIQDQVELALMRGGHHKVARAYVLYREERARERAEQAANNPQAVPQLQMKSASGQLVPLDEARLKHVVEEACFGLPSVSSEAILTETKRNLYSGITQDELALAPILAARTLIETEPDYSKVSARLLLDKLRREVLTFVEGSPREATHKQMCELYPNYLKSYIRVGIDADQLDPELALFDLDRIVAAIQPDRDLQFDYLGLQTLYDRYFLHVETKRFELPQAFFMRVAMGFPYARRTAK